MPKLIVQEITKQFPTRAEPLTVLREVSFTLSTGENLAIVGPSGCGKSTLLQILGSLDTPTSGQVTLDGVNPTTLAEPALAHFRFSRIGFVFQDHHLLPQCSVLENVLLPTLAEGAAQPAVIDRAKTLLEQVGLSARLDHRPAELSGGERQRTAIARALINRPTLLLADEPTGNLDRTTAEQVTQLLLDLQQAEHTILIAVTHSPDVAAKFARRVTLDDGRLQSLS